MPRPAYENPDIEHLFSAYFDFFLDYHIQEVRS